MAQDEFRGIPVHVEEWGSGPPLLMLHGGVSAGEQWQRVAAALGDRHRTIAPDLIGCGGTGAWPGPEEVSHDLQADLVAALIEGHGMAPAEVVAHSYGGACAVRLALRRPGLVRSLVLIEPVLMPLLREAGDPLFGEYRAMVDDFVGHARAGNGAAAWERFMDYRNGPGAWAALGGKAKARLMEQATLGMGTLLANLSNPTTLDDCRRIPAPVTIVCGEATTAPDRRVTELLRDAVPGCRYVTIPGAGHMSPLTHPEELAPIVLDHLGRGGAGAPSAS